jgi:hypothetical protein
MKPTLLLFCLLTFSAFAQALPKHSVLCQLQQEGGSEGLVTIASHNIEEMKTQRPAIVKLINQHLRELKYSERDLTFEEIQKLFTEGEYRHDDLYLTSYQDKATGTVYQSVYSYPGDNTYGLFFDIRGRVVASFQDGEVYLNNNGNKISCYDLQ